VGVRLGASFQHNMDNDALPYWDASDFWENGYGFSLEIPIDVNPWWGGSFGVGYEHFQGETIDYTFPDYTDGGTGRAGTTREAEMDPINLVPIYVGLVGRIPFWLDEKKWEEETDPVWIPNEPEGFAPYARGTVGGALLVNSPDVTYQDGFPGEDVDHRALDYQIFPFLEGSVGLEYRASNLGYWAEVGYRYYIIADRENQGFGSDRMARLNGIRVMAGLTYYFW
jgi:hypothetical protein